MSAGQPVTSSTSPLYHGGERIDLDAYIGVSKTLDHSEHKHLTRHAEHTC